MFENLIAALKADKLQGSAIHRKAPDALYLEAVHA